MPETVCSIAHAAAQVAVTNKSVDDDAFFAQASLDPLPVAWPYAILYWTV